MNPLAMITGLFRRRADGSSDDTVPDDTASGEGVPQGVPLPPPSRLDAVEATLDEDVIRSADVGLPPVGYPNRPLPSEEEAVKHHDIDQHQLSVWAREAKAVIAALLVEASDKLTHLAGQRTDFQSDQQATTSALDDAESELDEPDRRYFRQPGSWALALMLGGLLVLGALETNALQPILGQVLRQSDRQAWGLAVFMVAVLTGECHVTGVVLHRWLAYEGPRRMRVAHALGALVGLLLAAAALTAIVIIRMTGAKISTPGVTSLLYVAVQGGVELGALALGWWHGNPRVRQIRGLRQEIDALEDKLADSDDRIAEVAQWQQTLQEFSVNDFLQSRRPQLAADYAAVILAHRHNLWIELVERAHQDSADTLLLLPLPVFTPPADIDDDDGDWLTGGFGLAL
jgi:hypothetical protein